VAASDRTIINESPAMLGTGALHRGQHRVLHIISVFKRLQISDHVADLTGSS